MDGRDSGKAFLIGAGLLALASSLTGCLGANGQDMGQFPKFSDIPNKPAPVRNPPSRAAEVATLQGVAAALATQTSEAPTDSSWADAARARGAAPAPTAAEIDAEAFARAARARATPPPARK